ncbi:MAG TPA: signal peptidase I [Clostridia bacterium]|jgi:signal peptidase|nr:signal peptidase I [Clostridia bacterium]
MSNLASFFGGKVFRRILLVGMVLMMIILTGTELVPFANESYFIYFVRPLLWLGIALTVFLFPRTKPVARPSLRRFVINMAVGAAVVYILFMMVGGMITGLGKSPYSFGLVASTINLFYIAGFTLGVEAARSYLVNSYQGKYTVPVVALISLFFVFTRLSLREMQGLEAGMALMQYFGGTFFPAFAESLLTSYFAYLGGFVPAAAFHGILLAFERFSPILPDMTWPMKTFLGCFIPVFTLLFVRHMYFLQARLLKRTAEESNELFGWLLTSVFSVAMIWFAVGIFPVYPSVIVTGSMEPMIKPGDVVLVQKLEGDEVRLGDVIQYYHPEIKINITHRVIDINREGQMALITKGDNNSSVDADPVMPEQVKGKVIKVLPKVGWFTLILKSEQPVPEGVTY